MDSKNQKTSMGSILIRIVMSLIAIMVYGWINAILNPVATIMAGEAAGKQFENSNSAAVQASIQMDFFSHLGVPAIVLLGILVLIWWKPLSKLKAMLFVCALAVFGASLYTAPTPAYAYYDKTNLAEIYYVKPNETVFWIPDVGANLDSQKRMDSEEFYNLNKVPAKRFSIPHTKLQNSTGAFQSDYYVPAGRLIVVDRTLYSRVWHGSSTKGTDTKDQSIVCQSKEGINAVFAISLTASVMPQDAAKYLYWFGVMQPAGTANSPEVVFASVYAARSLNSVMDDVAYAKVHGLLCRETSKRSFDAVNAEATQIIDTVEEGTRKFLADRGITLQQMGMADTIGFDHSIQQAINDAYVGKTISGVLPAMHAQADIDVKRGLAENLKKFALPNFMPAGISDWFTNMFRTASTPAQAPQKK